LGLDKVHEFDTRLNNEEYNYEVENETELLKLERSLKRINRFARRELENKPEDHKRREKRMLDRAVIRKVHQVTHDFYTEAELQ